MRGSPLEAGRKLEKETVFLALLGAVCLKLWPLPAASLRMKPARGCWTRDGQGEVLGAVIETLKQSALVSPAILVLGGVIDFLTV